MPQPGASFGFAGRLLLLLIVAGAIAVVVVAVYGARETPPTPRGAMKAPPVEAVLAKGS